MLRYGTTGSEENSRGGGGCKHNGSCCVLLLISKINNKNNNHSYLGHGSSKENGPVQHPAAARSFQTIDEDSQQGQCVEQIHQHLQQWHTKTRTDQFFFEHKNIKSSLIQCADGFLCRLTITLGKPTGSLR